MSSSQLLEWLALERVNTEMTVRRISAEQCDPWEIAESAVFRPDGSFFSVEQKSTLFINQPEVGILAFLLFRESSRVSILVQAKPEPGNKFFCQIAPSIQATHSNYSRAHGGSETIYLNDLLSLLDQPQLLISDTLQSEHGHKFWKKLNRNISVFVPQTLICHQHFLSVPVRSLLDTLHEDFAINTDARSVLACSQWQSLLDEGVKPFTKDNSDWSELLRNSYAANTQLGPALDFLSESRKSYNPQGFTNRSLRTMSHRGQTHSILDEFNENNSIEFFEITCESREVPHWKQPLYLQKGSDIQVLLCRSTPEGLQFLLKARLEPGLANRAEFGASFNENDLNSNPESSSSHIIHEINRITQVSEPVVRCEQSDEGGRFFQNICEYSIFQVDENSLLQYSDEGMADKGYFWANLRTIQDLCGRDGLTTNELRTTISLLLYWL